MLEKRIGEACPTCTTPLMRRRSTFRTIVGDVAYCARCCSSFELAREEEPVGLLAPFAALAVPAIR
jgi:hypothetical protein